MATENEIRKAVTDMVGEWWKSGSEQTYQELALDLVRRGYTLDEAIDFLGTALSAAAAEYGE